MKPDEIQKRIGEKLPGSQIQIQDLTGTADHWQVTVVSKAFEGKMLLDRHRMVKGFFEGEIQTGDLHAFSLKTYTPDEWSRRVP